MPKTHFWCIANAWDVDLIKDLSLSWASPKLFLGLSWALRFSWVSQVSLGPFLTPPGLSLPLLTSLETRLGVSTASPSFPKHDPELRQSLSNREASHSTDVRKRH